MAANVAVRGNNGAIDRGKAVLSGVVAMVVFALIEMAFSWALRGASPWKPLDIFGAIALGQPVTAGADVHTAATTIVGALMLLALGALSGAVIALFVRRLRATFAVAAGALFGLAMYYVDMHGFARIFASLGDLRDWMSVLAYAIQGGLTAALYKAMARSLVDIVPEHAGTDMRRLREVPLF